MSEYQTRAPRADIKPLAAWLIVAALVLGFFVGRLASAGPSASAAEPDATATRTAELAELDQLRTQVAMQATACADDSQPTATPTQVPAGEMGQEHPYADGWTVIVIDAVPVPSTDAAKPTGVFLQVNLRLTNKGRENEIFPFNELVLVDSQQRSYAISTSASRELVAQDWDFFVEPSKPTAKSVIFDIAPDAGTSFVLESTSDPAFRVKVEIVQRG